ncbi:UTP--glucose-1-phosphate uridylyltransferase [Conexibacter sp. DBS9H8]|uniref:UTP--glucose-1-phosphate uridylyltransferase n=1 Tax=Conexibacter sp. DBS9H8 TaxID=2937801 RepID=UPI00200F1F71|nr:UTP--glucose-1-phosphate uridylyltransferase [Conexibacter sp. DBS9H8]
MTDLSVTDTIALAAEKMRAAGQSEEALSAFSSALTRLENGAQTLLPTRELEPVPDVPGLHDLPAADAADALAAVAVIKLNGGLATSMGLREPKSLIEARQGITFLDIIVGRILAQRAAAEVRLPLVLMNSTATREATLAALARHPELPTDGLELDFLQSMVPKLEADSHRPVSWPPDPHLEWCPPGHGDVYAALRGSGMLAALRAAGFRYAMISNADNLGATADPRIAAHLAREQIPFLMEVVRGTAADRKGGHLARRADGRLVLRETAQTPPEDEASFRDYEHWRYYNTNSIWVDLDRLEEVLDSPGGLELPVIVNHKTVDPRDKGSTPVLQLEAAMGAAIGSFPGARLIEVPRTRFAPVKTTDDLLVLRSDAYRLTDAFEVLPADPERLALVELDSRFYKLIDQFEARFPGGAPSLAEAERLTVHGDYTFAAEVAVRGAVELADRGAPIVVPAGTILTPDGEVGDGG